MIELEPRRSIPQNRKQWAVLRDVSKQVPWWHTNERGDWVFRLMDPESWKSVLTAGFERETRMALGTDGHTAVMVGASTSQYTRSRFCEYLEFVQAFGAEHEVEWSDDARAVFDEFRRVPRRNRSDGAGAAAA